ncbi:hypothetical protein HID58_022508 [Brassica napus]|uniref:Uncharacterized protein n=1 Tax=Brassica napus TaxID=3708 RepID=A0ABQ8CZI0_BRANA|nr:hypothetical protein HID58_022508 [Brassica napus]
MVPESGEANESEENASEKEEEKESSEKEEDEESRQVEEDNEGEEEKEAEDEEKEVREEEKEPEEEVKEPKERDEMEPRRNDEEAEERTTQSVREHETESHAEEVSIQIREHETESTQVEGPTIPAIGRGSNNAESGHAHADSVEAPGVEALKAMEGRLMNAISDGMKEVNKKVNSLSNQLTFLENKMKNLRVSVPRMSELPSEGESDNPSDQDGSDHPSNFVKLK